MHSLQLAIPAAANTCFLSNHKPLSLLSSFPNNLCKHNASVLLRFHLARTQNCSVSGNDSEKKLIELPAGLEPEFMPKHVALIMDGNRRWAIERGFPAQHGHVVGAEAMEEFTRNCFRYGVKVVSLFAISTENMIRRSQVEIESLINLFRDLIMSHTEELMQKNVRISFIGSKGQFPQSFQKLMYDAEERTKENKRMHILFGLNYGGRYDITEATKKIATKVKGGAVEVEDIDDAVFELHLETRDVEFPNPDLLIRSSGELRVSNFMMWQLAYTEMFFTNKVFPEFDGTDLVEAIAAFQQRRRRFGGQKH